MGKGAPLRWLENQILRRHLRGRGIEIGALWRKFPIKSGLKIWYVDRYDSDGLGAHYTDLGRSVVKPDLVADASQLPFADGTLNFIIASHLLEHLQFPLAALQRWYELLAAGGVLLLRVPDKRFTFDSKRARTPLAHVISEDAHPADFDKRAHFLDFVEHIGRPTSGQPSVAAEVERLMQMDYSIHYHVWTSEDVEEILEYMRVGLKLNWRTLVFWGAHFYRKETVVLLQRGH